MSTATLHAPVGGAGHVDAAPEKREGFFSRILKAMVESQQARANRAARAGLAQLPDSQLIELGYTPEQIGELRQFRGALPYWC